MASLSCIYYRGWFGQLINYFLKYQKTRLKIDQIARGNEKSLAAVCFTYYFISPVPKFLKMQNTRLRVILLRHVIYLVKSKVIIFKLITDRKLKLWWRIKCNQRGCLFNSCFSSSVLISQLYKKIYTKLELIST